MPYTSAACSPAREKLKKEKIEHRKKGLLLSAFKLYRHSIDICIFFYPVYVISVWHEKLLFEKEREREKRCRKKTFLYFYVEANNSFRFLKQTLTERVKEKNGYLRSIRGGSSMPHIAYNNNKIITYIS